MSTTSKVGLSLALVLASASAVMAAPKHPARHHVAIHRQAPASGYQSYGSVTGVGTSRPQFGQEEDYMRIQDQDWGY
jgi:hypothetical protein